MVVESTAEEEEEEEEEMTVDMFENSSIKVRTCSLCVPGGWVGEKSWVEVESLCDPSVSWKHSLVLGCS